MRTKGGARRSPSPATTNSPLWSRKDRRAESCPSDTPSSPSSPSSWPAPPGASYAAATSSRSGTPPSAPRPCSWTRLRSRSGVNIREKYLEELKNIFYLFGFVGRVVDTLGVVILGHCRGEGHPVIVRDLEHGDDEYHENLWCWCCDWCSECILSPRAGVWCWLIMKWLVWVTAGLRLSGTRVKPRLISCLEVAYTTIHQYILLLLFRQDECLEVVFLGSLKSYHACWKCIDMDSLYIEFLF